MRRRHTTENSVITTFHPMLLIGSEVNVLRHDERTRLDALTGNAAPLSVFGPPVHSPRGLMMG